MNQIIYPHVLNEIRDSISDGLESSHNIMKKVADSAPGKLSYYMNELVSRKGKRMRASFVHLISSCNGDFSEDRAALVSASIELLHLATLVHDDIIDESERRRNELTAHKKWGSRVAVLVGDYALSTALELIINDVDRRIPASISRSASKLVAGEILEIEHSGNKGLDLETYYEVIYGKTASLWETCGECAGIVANFDDELVQDSAKMGRNMGMTFQIIDDLLDFGFGAENLGKEKNSDLQNGLMTMPLIIHMQEADAGEREKLERLLNEEVTEDSQKQIFTLLDQSGAFERAKNIAFENVENCFEILRKFPQSKYTEYLKELCELLANRSY